MHRKLIQFSRLALLPFPAAVAICFFAVTAADYSWRPDRSQIERAPFEGCATVLFVLVTALLQIIWGIPSILALDKSGAGLRGYLAVGAASAALLSLSFAAFFQRGAVGETFGWMFSYASLFFGIPLLLCFLLALWLRPSIQDRPGRAIERTAGLIILAAVGLLIVGAVAIDFDAMDQRANLRRRDAKGGARALRVSLLVYKSQHRALPFLPPAGSTAPVYASGPQQNVELAGLRPDRLSPAGEVLDPWKHPFVFSTAGDAFLVVSRGPDGRLGTADDISSDD